MNEVSRWPRAIPVAGAPLGYPLGYPLVPADALGDRPDEIEAANGFANRFMWACARNSDGNPDSPQVVVFLATIIDVTVGS